MTDATTPTYPSYDEDESLFALFLREHTILQHATTKSADDDDNATDSDSDDDDNLLLEPTSEGKTLMKRISAYTTHLQRIKDRIPYNVLTDWMKRNVYS